MNERSGPDLVTAIIAVFIGGLGVSIVTTIAAPAVASRTTGNMTTFIGVQFGLAAIGSVFSAGVVRSIFFDRHPSYARVLFALLLGQAVNALVLLATATAASPNPAVALGVLGWAGFAVSVFVLMGGNKERKAAGPQWEYKVPPGRPVWGSAWQESERRSRGT